MGFAKDEYEKSHKHTPQVVEGAKHPHADEVNKSIERMLVEDEPGEDTSLAANVGNEHLLSNPEDGGYVDIDPV